MAPYFMLIFIVAAVSYFIIKKYLPNKCAIGISLWGFVLSAIFPLIMARLNLQITIIIYIVIGLLASIVVRRLVPAEVKQDPISVKEFEAVVLETAATSEQDLSAQDQFIAPVAEEFDSTIDSFAAEEFGNDEEIATEEEIFSEVIDNEKQDVQDYFEITRPVVEEAPQVEVLEFAENVPQPIEPQQLESQLPEISELEPQIAEIAEEAEVVVDDSEEEYVIPDSYSYVGITRSIIVEPEVELESQTPELSELPKVLEHQEPLNDDLDLSATVSDTEASIETLAAETSVVEEDSHAVKLSEPVIVPKETLTVKQLITNGLSQSRQGNYNDAVKMLMEALKQQPEPKLKYLAVSEVSTIYQHIGFYQLAASILAAYIKQRDLQDHPGIDTWREKLIYLNIMIELLKENKLPSLPYNEVPDFIKKKAFSKTLEKINK
jgi:tetratricopeptide (TPR) repeat protein